LNMKKLNKGHLQAFVGLLGGLLIFALIAAPLFAQRTTPQRKLELAEDLARSAAKRADEAKRTGDTRMVQEVLDMTREALSLVSEVVVEVDGAGNEEPAKDTYRVADKVITALMKVGAACLSCAETAAAPAAAPCCCECNQGQQLLELAFKSTGLISGMVDEAEETKDDELVQLGYDMANKAGKALAALNEAWTHCAKTLADAGTVACCRENATQVAGVAELMDRAKRETVVLGAEPEVPPTREEKFRTDDETPIRDHEQPPASPIRP